MSDVNWKDDNHTEVLPRKTIYEIVQMRPIKLELGGGAKPAGGYLNVDLKDIPEVDFIADISTLDAFPDGSVDAILARDVLQCFHREEVVTVLRRWFRKMRRSSRLVIQVVDFKQIFEVYQDGKVCGCWDSASKSSNSACTKCKGKATMSYDKFSTYLYGRNRDYEMFKSSFDLEDLTWLIEKAGFTIMETQKKELRILIIAKKVVR